MDALELINQAQSLGARIWRDGEHLELDAPADFPEELVELLRCHKAAVLQALAGKGRKHSVYEIPRLLAWASELAEQELVLPRPVTYVETPLRTITTPRVSYYAALYLREISYTRLQQRTGGWGRFTTERFKEQDRGAIQALAALREAIQTQVEPEANS
jgi:hypothetical protein